MFQFNLLLWGGQPGKKKGAPFTLDENGMLPIPRGPGLGIKWSAEGIFKHSGMHVSSQVNVVPKLPQPAKL